MDFAFSVVMSTSHWRASASASDKESDNGSAEPPQPTRPASKPNATRTTTDLFIEKPYLRILKPLNSLVGFTNMMADFRFVPYLYKEQKLLFPVSPPRSNRPLNAHA